jgi:chemotaxis protein CheD
VTHHFSHRFHKEMWIINPGEFLASGEDIVIGTILGSCVSVVLHDPISQVGGMNHFLLSDVGYHVDVDSPQFLVTKGRFGIHAMELLINEMLKKGASRKELEAKVFGGANMLISSNAEGSTVPQKNIEFALRFLEKERIPVVNSDVGGTQARKIFLMPRSFEVHKLIAVEKKRVERLEKREENFAAQIARLLDGEK